MRSDCRSAGPTLTGIGDEAALGIDGQLAAIAELGWRTLELRTVDGIPLADLPEAAFDRAACALADAGVDVVAVDARIGGWARPVTGDFTADLDELDVLARRCARLGTRYVRVMSYPNDSRAPLDPSAWEAEVLGRMAVLAHRAADAGLVLLHENCSGWAGTDAERMVRLLDVTGGTGFGLLLDTGNGPAYGYDNHALLRRILPWTRNIHHVHVKDAVLGVDGRPAYREPGAGELRVAEGLRLLLDHGYTGAFSLEPHVAVRPHENHGDAPEECHAAFVRCGLALRRLLDDSVLPRPVGQRPAEAAR
ncbi:sugar phosphate isomerase/epimerase [Streptacidiphilus sp. BW17]|uniref:sugar phosphate isomerase/epimerase family protein n=1 Tax=Streptacidiphilus sp. BW17 TaxID=3156274 RepID=UPI003515398C